MNTRRTLENSPLFPNKDITTAASRSSGQGLNILQKAADAIKEVPAKAGVEEQRREYRKES